WLLFLRPLDYLGKAARIKARATDERAVDIGLRHERAGVVWLHAAAVLNSNLVGGRFVGNSTERPPDERMCFLRLFRRRSLACPDCPNRLVGNHRLEQFLGA